MNKTPVLNEHAGMIAVISRVAEEEKIPCPQLFAAEGNRASPSCPLIGISGHYDSAATHQHLRKARAIKAKTRCAAPGVSHSQEAARQSD
jgi:hypothetical protein